MKRDSIRDLSVSRYTNGDNLRSYKLMNFNSNKLYALLCMMSLLMICMFHKHIYEKFNSLEKVNDFSLNNEKTFYSTLQSKENILIFWASWCPHCENTLSFILDNKDRIGNIFTVSIDDNLDDINKFQGQFPIYLDFNQMIFKSALGEYLPTVYILDKRGNVLGSSQGETDSKELIQKYIENNR